MEGFIQLLEEPEERAIWDRVYEELQFRPSVRENGPAFQVPEPWVVHGLPYFPIDEQYEAFEAAARETLAASLGEDDWIYALDWHHSYFRYDPRLPITEHSHWVEDESYMGRGYDAWFPDFYPDGDYYFFVQRELNWGWLGHPWRREIWLYGEPLVSLLSPRLEALGFPAKRTPKKE